MKVSKRLKRLLKWGIICSLLAIFTTEILVNVRTKEYIYTDVEAIPHRKVGLLLGTANKTRNGYINPYYQYRVDAAVELFQAGKIDYILVSGDNGSTSYDEPTTFKNDLIARGIPVDKIILDYAGFRTLDSVIRAKKVFGQDGFTIISQPFHNVRAVFIGRTKGIDAIGYNAKKVGNRFGLKVQLRERLARVKMVLDLVLGVKPKFLGAKIQIGE